MKERLFFDWIALLSGYVAPRNVELPVAIEADFADSGLAFGNRAAMPAGIAAHTLSIVENFVQLRISLSNALIDDFAQCRHETILRRIERHVRTDSAEVLYFV